MRFATVNEAAHAWVAEFNAIPQGMIARLMEMDVEEGECNWQEVTLPDYGDRVYLYDGGVDGIEYGEIIEVDYDKEAATLYKIQLDGGGKTVWLGAHDFEVERDDSLPMWGTMWSFGDCCDDDWLENGDGIRKMCDCGFRIYFHEEWGYFFGIDGAGYDFYSEHWIPAYHARGLKWADEQYEEVR